MEKQGMDPGRKTNRTGLLKMKTSGKFRVMLTVFLLMISSVISAQDTGSAVTVETSPETPSAGVPWILTLLVDHSVSDEVTIITPPFDGALFPDRFMKIPRMTGTHIQTVIEFRFIPARPGIFTLEPFRIITPAGITETDPLVLEIRGPGAEQRPAPPRLVWEGVPRQMAAGEKASFALRVTGNSRQPPQEFFMPEVPHGVILVSSPLSAEERAGGMAIKLTLIPLETGDFRLPERLLQYENTVYDIPALYIRVTGRAAGSPAVREQLNSETASAAVAQAQFPGFDSNAFDKPLIKTWRGQCENIYNSARNLWDNGFRARALSELRRGERDHPAGALLLPIRQKAEENLGIFNTGNENRQRQKLLLCLSIFFFFFVIISPFVCYKFLKGTLRKKAVLLCTVAFTALSIFCFYAFMDSRSVFRGKSSRFGVTNETPVRRTADFEGKELFSFREGQPVVIMLNSGSWVYVRANDLRGGSGWIPAREVIYY